MFVKSIKILTTLCTISYCWITSSHAAESQQYYISLGVNKSFILHDIRDVNETDYSYNFTKKGIDASLCVGKHLNDKFTIGIEGIAFAQLKHSYTGSMMLIDALPGIPWINKGGNLVIAKQNASASSLFLTSKYHYKPSIFSTQTSIYVQGGIGTSFNTMGEYKRTVRETLDIMYPKHTQTTLAWKVGTGLEKTFGDVTISLGYNFYNLGGFSTKNEKVIVSRITKKTILKTSNSGKKFDQNLTLHAVTLGFSMNF